MSIEYVYEGDPEPVQDEQPLGEVMYDLTPDDGVEDDDSVGACAWVGKGCCCAPEV